MTIVDFLWLFVYLIVTICIANIGLCLLRMDLKKLLLLWMPLLDTIIGIMIYCKLGIIYPLVGLLIVNYVAYYIIRR